MFIFICKPHTFCAKARSVALLCKFPHVAELLCTHMACYNVFLLTLAAAYVAHHCHCHTASGYVHILPTFGTGTIKNILTIAILLTASKRMMNSPQNENCTMFITTPRLQILESLLLNRSNHTPFTIHTMSTRGVEKWRSTAVSSVGRDVITHNPVSFLTRKN